MSERGEPTEQGQMTMVTRRIPEYAKVKEAGAKELLPVSIYIGACFCIPMRRCVDAD